jgi:teichuronic acid exporter
MDAKEINKRLISGFFTLTFRKAALLAISWFTINIILARVLPIDVIGVFNVANTILAVFAYFAEIGLGAALIQKKELTEQDIKTTFTIQTTLMTLVAVIVFLAAPLAAHIKGLDETGVWLVRALAFAFFLNAFKIIPSTLLERDLKFKKLVSVEIVETLIFNATLIFFVFQGMRVEAFTIAAVIRPVLGVIILNLIAPWRLALGFSRESAKTLLNFGVPFQLNSLLALFKDRLVAIVVAFMIGASGVSLNTWAQNLAFLPLEIMNAVIRVLFPAFSRLQNDTPSLQRTLERSIFLTCLLLYPLLFGILALAPFIIKYVVLSKWNPALPLIYLYAVTVFWATLSTSFTNFLNAIGKIRITLKLMIMWTILEWCITPPLTYVYGFYGPAISSALISFTSIITIVIVKKHIDIKIISNIWQPLLASVVMGALTFGIANFLVSNILTLLLTVLMGGAIYLGLVLLLAKHKILENVRGIGQ